MPEPNQGKAPCPRCGVTFWAYEQECPTCRLTRWGPVLVAQQSYDPIAVRTARPEALDAVFVKPPPSPRALPNLDDLAWPPTPVKPPREALSLDDRAVAVLTRWIKAHRFKISKRALAKTLGCHHSSLENCPTFLRLWQTSQAEPSRGFRTNQGGNVDAFDD